MSTSSTTKRATRAKKEVTDIPIVPTETASVAKTKNDVLVSEFTTLLQKITAAKNTFESLQKEITETKETWEKEQKDHDAAITERNQQEEILRKREQEMYDYETGLARKKTEDDFTQRKTQWERELQESKETIEQERREIETLRKQVAGIETEKEKAIKEASTVLQKDLTAQFETERKLREQELKGEKAILQLRIDTFIQEVTRQKAEITALKESLENTTTQLKEVAVRVIDSAKPTIIKSNVPSDEDKPLR